MAYQAYTRRASQAADTSPFTLPSLDDHSVTSRFNETRPLMADLLLSHIDMVPAKPQRHMGVVLDAVKHYQSEVETLPDPSKLNATFSLGSLFSKADDSSTNHYHAISRLYASVYSQFPDEADLHIDHKYIENMNQDVWGGKSVTPKEIQELTTKMNDLLDAVGYRSRLS